MSTGLMHGKRGLIMGLANDKSIAWGIAKALADQGAELAFSYQGEALKKRVEPLMASIGATEMYECDVSDEATLDGLFAHLKSVWGHLDFVAHAIGFSDKNELRGRYAKGRAVGGVAITAWNVQPGIEFEQERQRLG